MSAPLPCIAAASSSAGLCSASVRSTWTHGQNAGAPSPSQPRAHTTRMFWLRAYELSCSESRVLPMPGSPDSSTSRPLPACTSPSRPIRRARSWIRPTNVALGASSTATGSVAAGRRRVPAEARVLGEDLLLERPQLGSGLDPELLDEHVARVLVGAQRVGLPARPVQREHQQLAEPLPDRVLLGEPLGLDRDRRVPAPFQIDRELGLQRDEVQLLEPLALGLRPRLVRDVGEGLAPPEGEGVGEVDAGVVEPAPLPRLDRGGDVALEPGGIHLLGRDVEDVAGRPGDQDGRRRAGGAVRLEHPAQVGHVGLEGRRRRGRRLAVPELVDQPVDGDDPSRLQQEQRQQGPVFGRAELHAGPAHRPPRGARAARTPVVRWARRPFSLNRRGSAQANPKETSVASPSMPDSTLPGDVHATIGRRVELLADDTRRMLAAASVFGRRFDVAPLAAAVKLDPDVVTAALREAVAAEVVVDDGGGHYTFAHALIEDTLYDSLTPTAAGPAPPRRGRGARGSRRRRPAAGRDRVPLLPGTAGGRSGPGGRLRAPRRERRGAIAARPNRRSSTSNGRAKRPPAARSEPSTRSVGRAAV